MILRSPANGAGTPPGVVDAEGGDGPGRPRVCPSCGHAREGVPASERENARRLKRGKPLIPPACAVETVLPLGDVDDCGCTDVSHSERLVDSFRPA